MKAHFIVIAIVLVACGTKRVASDTPPSPPAPPAPPAAMTDEMHVEKGAARFPGYNLAMYQEGKALYDGNCQSCHKLYKPESISEADWKGIVPNMVVKTNRKAGATVITPEKEEVMLKYLLTMAKS